MPARLTSARKNLWAAFDADADLKSAFRRTYRFDETDPAGDLTGPLQPFPPLPALSQLPALALFPPGGGTSWSANQSQRLEYRLQASLWTPHWSLPKAEDLWERLVVCWWKTVDPDTGIEFWRGDPNANLGVWDMELGAFTVAAWKTEPSNRDSPYAVRLDWPVILRMNWNPRA